MENKLEIQKKILNDSLQFQIKGRIDAYWSEYLNNYIADEIRAGNRYLEFDLSGVTFISSIGIRLFIRHLKELHKINGHLSITAASPDVRKVFELAGLQEIFESKTLEEKQSDLPLTEVFQSEQAMYKISRLGHHQGMSLMLTGDPGKLKDSSFTVEDFMPFEFSDQKFGLGMGALGSEIEDYSMRTGEFIGLSNIAAYLPGDGTRKPDYMLSTGELIPVINVLYGLLLEGEFTLQVNFELKTERHLALHHIIDDILKLSGYRDIAMVMLAETSGLVGAAINQSPFSNVNGESPLQYPEIRNNINFTTEPAHDRMLALVTGVALQENNDRIRGFTRPVKAHSPINGHFHAAVFPFIPMKKNNISLNETLNDLFEYSHLSNLLHLINDEREINGVGESEFIQGICWIGEIDNIK